MTASGSTDLAGTFVPHADSPGRSRREFLKLAGLAALTPGLLAACGGSGDSPPGYAQTIADARTAIRAAMTASNTPAVSVALVERGRVIWAEAFGVIDKASGTVPTTDTLFCIGSCSKLIAAVAVMLLVERGLVDLDAPLTRYLPGFRMASPEYARVTVRMLINHSSGFPGSDYRGIFRDSPSQDYAAQVMDTLATARLKHAPGEMSVYCNDGFTMVEPLVKAMTGKDYPAFVADEILAPLGMTRSRFALQPFPEGTFAHGYTGDARMPQEFTVAYASGGLYTTPSEMGRLARMMLDGGQIDGVRLLEASSLAEMARNQTVNEPLRPVPMDDGYGLGWDGVRQPGFAAAGVTAWHKNGGTVFFSSDFFVLPDEGLALMITGSSSGYGAGALAERILLNALVERGRVPAMPGPFQASRLPEAAATDADLAAIAGLYAHYQGMVKVDVAPDRTLSISLLSGAAWSAPTTGWKRRSDGSWSSDASPDRSYVLAASGGERYLVARMPYGMGHYQWQLPYAQKMKPGRALPAVWRARTDKTWVAANEPLGSFGFMGGMVFNLTMAPDLPGYLLANAGTIDKHSQIGDPSGSDNVLAMCLKLPFAFGRDLDDVIFEPRAGEEWVRVGSSVFRPLDTVPPAGIGSHSVTIGSEGWAEWRRVSGPAQFSSRGAQGWVLFDADIALIGRGMGDATGRAVPAGAFLLLYGAAGESVAVTLAG